MKQLENWQPCEPPPHTTIIGRFCRLEPMVDKRYFDDLWQACSADGDGAIWAYMPYGPFVDRAACMKFAAVNYPGPDPMYYAVIDTGTNRAIGVASLMRINADHGVIEIGNICYGPLAQQTAMTTEVLYLVGCRIFDELGYRRFEWKCNAKNQASLRAAKRFGFTFEGIFRQAMVLKGQNRDTAWYSIIYGEWPKIKAGFEAWLAPQNFDDNGRQICSLAELRG